MFGSRSRLDEKRSSFCFVFVMVAERGSDPEQPVAMAPTAADALRGDVIAEVKSAVEHAMAEWENTFKNLEKEVNNNMVVVAQATKLFEKKTAERTDQAQGASTEEAI